MTIFYYRSHYLSHTIQHVVENNGIICADLKNFKVSTDDAIVFIQQRAGLCDLDNEICNRKLSFIVLPSSIVFRHKNTYKHADD